MNEETVGGSKIDEEQKAYEERRIYLNNIRDDSIGSFDKAILQLSTGALAVTIAFLDKIGKPYDALTIVLLYLSWIGFLLVIFANLLSHHFAGKNSDAKIKDLDARHTTYLQTGEKPPEKDFCYKSVTHFCNSVALWGFLISAAFFVIYAICVQTVNYKGIEESKKEVSMTEKKISGRTTDGKTETSELVKRGKTETAEPVRPAKSEPEKPKR